MMNEFAKKRIIQYGASVYELYNLMNTGQRKSHIRRMNNARRYVQSIRPDDLFTIDRDALEDAGIHESSTRAPNPHLSLMGLIRMWYRTKTNPYEKLVGGTPPYKLLLGATHMLMDDEEIWDESLNASFDDPLLNHEEHNFQDATAQMVRHVDANNEEGYLHNMRLSRTYFKKSKRLDDLFDRSKKVITAIS